MFEITLSEIMNYACNMGLTAVLLVVFVWFFIQRAKKDDERAKNAQEESEKKSAELL